MIEQFDRTVEQRRHHVMSRQISMLHELHGIRLNVFSHLNGATKLWADASIKMITEVMLAIIQKDSPRTKRIPAMAALNGAHYAAQAIADLGDMNFRQPRNILRPPGLNFPCIHKAERMLEALSFRTTG